MSQKQFWRKFLNKDITIAVHCNTDTDAIEFCKMMHDKGLRWCSGRSYLNTINWYMYKENTCYTNDGFCCDYEYCKKDNNIIYEYEDIFTKR